MTGFICFYERDKTFCDENNIPSLRSQSWDIAKYPKIENQSNCAILGVPRLAYTKTKDDQYRFFQYAHYARCVGPRKFIIYNKGPVEKKTKNKKT